MNTTAGKPKIQGKKPSHRRAILRSLLLELIRNERLQTTPTKGKLLKQQFDRLITQAKRNTSGSRAVVSSTLRNDKAMQKLEAKLLPRLGDINSGYTYSANTLPRKGDNAPQMVLVVRGAEIREGKSKLTEALQRREKQDQKKQESKLTSRIKRAVRGDKPKTDGRKKEVLADTRRIST